MKEQVSVAKCCADCGQSVFNHDEKVCHRKKIFNQAQVNEDDMRQLLTQSPGFVTLEREECERLKQLAEEGLRLRKNIKKKINELITKIDKKPVTNHQPDRGWTELSDQITLLQNLLLESLGDE